MSFSGKRNHPSADQGSEMATAATPTKKEKKTRKVIPIPEDIEYEVYFRGNKIDEEDAKVFQSIQKILADADKDIFINSRGKDLNEGPRISTLGIGGDDWDEACWDLEGGLLKRCFLKLDALQSLWFPETGTLPPWIDELQNLKFLYFTNRFNYSCEILSDKIGNLQNLETLVFKDVETAFLPTSIGNLTNLNRLQIVSCPLVSVPDEIRGLTNLKILELWDTSLTSLPAAIGSLTNLESLDMGYRPNNVRELPDEIGNLTNLTYMNLHRSKISSLPSSIGNLSNLRELNLQSTKQLRTLPDSVRNLNRLEILRLEGSNVTFPSTVYRTMKNLRVLNIDKRHYSNTTVLQELLKELPRLVCLGQFHTYSMATFEECFLRNRIRSRVTRLSTTHQKSLLASYPPLSLWPLILEQAKRTTHLSEDCIDRAFVLEPPFEWAQSDAIFWLLVDHGENIVPRVHQLHRADTNAIH